VRVGLAWVIAIVALAAHIAAADDPQEYEIQVPDSAELELGEPGAVSLTLAPEAGYAISKDAPIAIALTVTPETGLGLPMRRYTRKHAADARAESPRFDLAARGTAAGQYTLGIDIRFWVCAKKTCRPVAEQRKVQITVVTPPPPPVDAGPPDAGRPDGAAANAR